LIEATVLPLSQTAANIIAAVKTRCAQRAETPPKLLHCLGNLDYIVREKHDGALCQVKIHHRKPDVCYVNRSGK